LVLAVILIAVFGYKKLPQLGRSAGTRLRSAGESAKQLSSSVGDKVSEQASDKFDPSAIGKSAGRGLREAREFKDALTGSTEIESKPKTGPPPAPAPAPAQSASPASSADPPSPPPAE
jgi:Sec-independent protein translocase protein TatA